MSKETSAVRTLGIRQAYPFHNDGSLEYRQAIFAMNLANVYAKYRAAGITCTREEFHKAAIENMDKIEECLKQPLTSRGHIKNKLTSALGHKPIARVSLPKQTVRKEL